MDGFKMKKIINLPLTQDIIEQLTVGDEVLLNGTVYTARDAAHKRLVEDQGTSGKFPLSLKNQMIYYVGPCPEKPGEIIGSAGPTTSGRMDVYTPLLLGHGLKGMMGKGNRNNEVINAIKANKAVYFGVIGGVGAMLRDCIKKSQIVAYEDLGTEAIRKIEIKDFPCIVAVDSRGNNIYDIEPKKYIIKEER